MLVTTTKLARNAENISAGGEHWRQTRRADRSEGRARYIGQEENYNIMGIPQKALTLYILWGF